MAIPSAVSNLEFIGRDAEAVAAELAEQFARTAVERDRRGGTPKHERDLLRTSGLLSLSIPTAFGGMGGSYSQVMRVVRRIANADGSLAHVFGFQHLLLATVRLFGDASQWETRYAETAAQNLFWGNALNPLDPNTTLVTADGRLRIAGRKSFCSGALDSERLVVSALRDSDSKLFVAVLPTDRKGIKAFSDWDNFGQRQTDSGTVEFDEVEVRESELLTSPGPLSTPFSCLRPCIAQLLLSNVYLGIAEGAFQESREYAMTQRRPWSTSGASRAAEDPFIQRRMGEFWVSLESARMLCESAAKELDHAWHQAENLVPAERGQVAVKVATAKVATTQTSLDITSRMFDVMGARATAAKLGMDRFFRNARTHTLHDPVDYKLKELGAFALQDVFPTPSFYS